MPDKKLTDSEIVKALECCNKNDCKECPYGKYNITGWCCMPKVRKDALDLINRQKAEIENLTKACENQQKISMDRYFEIERLKTLNSKLEAENYSFKVKERENPLEMALLIDQQAEQLKTAKAEAYKEFAELLSTKANVQKVKILGGLHAVKVVTLHDINSLKKELERENSAG